MSSTLAVRVSLSTETATTSSSGSIGDGDMFNNMFIQKLCRIDEDISMHIFKMQLPVMCECLLSLPGNCFGMVPSTLIGPLWMAIILSSKSEQQLTPMFYIVTILSSFVCLAAWVAFLTGYDDRGLKSFLANKTAYILAPALSTIFLYNYTQTQSKHEDDYFSLFSVSVYSSFLWILSLPIALVLLFIARFSRLWQVENFKGFFSLGSCEYLVLEKDWFICLHSRLRTVVSALNTNVVCALQLRMSPILAVMV